MSMTFSLQLPDGTREQHDVTPGGKLRLAVGERDGAHGTLWNLWAGKTKSDFYLAERNTARMSKWSFHESGMWLHQFEDSPEIEAEARATGYTGRGRAVDNWQQPPEIGDSGWTLAFSIRTRHQDLDVYDDDARLPQDVCWAPSPPEGSACYLDIYIVRPTGVTVELQGMVPLCAFGLADNRQVLVLARFHPLSEETNTSIGQWIDGAVAVAPSGSLRMADRPRLTMHSIRDDGLRMVWDMAIPPQRLTSAPYSNSESSDGIS